MSIKKYRLLFKVIPKTYVTNLIHFKTKFEFLLQTTSKKESSVQVVVILGLKRKMRLQVEAEICGIVVT